MKNLTPKTLLLLLPLAIATGCNSVGGGGDTSSVAMVNNEPITTSEYLAYLERKPSVQIMLANGTTAEANVANPLGLQAFRDLVNRRILTQIAKDEGVYPAPADIKKEIDFQTRRNANFIRDLTSRGITLETIRGDLAMGLARERLLSKGITVTQQDVDTYIKENRRKFTTPELADLLWVVVRTPEQKKQVDREISGGQSFESVADRLSEVPNTGTNRIKFPQNRVELFPADLRAMVDNTGETGTTGWLRFGANRDRWAKFYVLKKTASRAVPVDEDMREAVRREIAMERGSEANDLQRRIQDKLKTADIKINKEWLKDPWQKAMNSLRSANQGPAGGAPVQ